MLCEHSTEARRKEKEMEKKVKEQVGRDGVHN